MLHNSPLLYHTKSELVILLRFIFHCSTRSAYANFLVCHLLHRHNSSCCLLEPFTFCFLFKAFLQRGCLIGTKIFQASDNLDYCEHRLLAAVPPLGFTLYFLLIQNESMEQALVGHKRWQKRCPDIVGQWHSRGARRISLPHWFLVDSHTISTGHTRAKGRYCNMCESIAGALKIEWQRVILITF